MSFIPSVIHDAPPLFKKFGDVVRDVEATYRRGATPTVAFVGANPRNDLQLEGSYAVLEKLIANEEYEEDSTIKNARLQKVKKVRRKWRTVRNDGDWHLVFRWRRVSELLATSEVEIAWETGTDPWAEPGTYRFRYLGDSKSFSGRITSFEGVSGEFELLD